VGLDQQVKIKNMSHYRPLPNYLTIKPSTIDGLGLFTNIDIDNNFTIGVTHVKDPRFEDGYIRTPLGAFINHSDTPNGEFYEDGDFMKVRTLTKIKSGDELIVTYQWYNPTK